MSLDSFLDILVPLVAAIVLGGLVGLEREWGRKPAGLRTHMMVSLGAATFTLLAFRFYEAAAADSAARMDPIRLIAGIIGGIGFLGAGSIIRGRGSVEGLTTAGSIWFVGSVGVAAGGGYYAIAVISVALGLLVLRGLGFLEHRLPSHHPGAEHDRRR